MLGALIGAGSSLIGGLLGSKDSKRARQMSQAQFDAQMDTTIQRRVKDANKAGIHPLYALGSSPGASPTIMAGQHGSGSALGDAISSAGSEFSRYTDRKHQRRKENLAEIRQLELQEAQIKQLNASAQADQALTAKRLSETKRMEASVGQGLKAKTDETAALNAFQDPHNKSKPYRDPWGKKLPPHKGSTSDFAAEQMGEIWPEIDIFLWEAQRRARTLGMNVDDWYERQMQNYRNRYGIK